MSATERAARRPQPARVGPARPTDRAADAAALERRATQVTRGAARAAVLGVSDGLVSNVSLILGVAGADASAGGVRIAGFASLLAGALSMAAGEWVSVQSQRELYEREIAVEREELAAFPEEELEELILIYQAKGLSGDEARALARRIMRRPETALDTLTREELGLAPGDLGSPWVAALSSFASFAVGASIPVLPFLVGAGPPALAAATVLSALTLFLVGSAIALLTGRSPARGGARMVGIATVVGLASHLIGRLVGAGVAV